MYNRMNCIIRRVECPNYRFFFLFFFFLFCETNYLDPSLPRQTKSTIFTDRSTGDLLTSDSNKLEKSNLLQQYRRRVEAAQELVDDIELFQASLASKPLYISGKELYDVDDVPCCMNISANITRFLGMAKAEYSHLDQTLRRLSDCLDVYNEEYNDSFDCVNDDDLKEQIHKLESSNLIFYQTLWHQTKACGANGDIIVSVLSKIRLYDSKSYSTIDIVTNYGAQWIKLINDTPKTIIEKLTRSEAAVPIVFEEPFISEGDDLFDFSPEAYDTIDVVQTIKKLTHESRRQPVRIYGRLSYPEVRVIFTRLGFDDNNGGREFQLLIKAIEQLGANVELPIKNNCVPSGSMLASCEREALFKNIQLGLTQVLNIDVTVLLAMISDITVSIGLGIDSGVKGCSLRKRAEHSFCDTCVANHCQLIPCHREDMHESVRRQVESELRCPSLRFLVTLFHTGQTAYDLVVTRSAWNKFYDILNIMASQSERERADQLFAKPYDKSHYLDVSIFGFSLPKIRVVNDPSYHDTELFADMSDFNRTIFGYSIANHVTTISSNFGVYKQIQAYDSRKKVYEQPRKDLPNIILVQARSLLGNMRPCKCA